MSSAKRTKVLHSLNKDKLNEKAKTISTKNSDVHMCLEVEEVIYKGGKHYCIVAIPLNSRQTGSALKRSRSCYF